MSQQPSIPFGCSVSHTQLQAPSCTQDNGYKHAVLSVVMEFLRRAPQDKLAVSLLAQFPIRQRFQEIRREFQTDQRTFTAILLRHQATSLLADDVVQSSQPSVSQLQMYARLMIFLSYELYRPNVDPTDEPEFAELTALMSFVQRENALECLGRIHRLLLASIPELKTMQAGSGQKLDVGMQVPQSTMMSAVKQMAATPAAAGPTQPIEQLGPIELRTELEEWVGQVNRDADDEATHQRGADMMEKSYMQYGRVHGLYSRIQMHMAGRVSANDLQMPPQSNEEKDVPEIALWVWAFVTLRGRATLDDAADRSRVYASLSTVSRSTFYPFVRELRRFLNSRTTRTNTKSATYLQWFAPPASLPQVMTPRLLRRVREVLVDARNQPIHDSESSNVLINLQLNTYLDTWLKPLVMSFAVLQPDFWSMTGSVWQAYIEQWLIYLWTNPETLGFDLIQAVRARLTLLGTELAQLKEQYQSQKEQVCKRETEFLQSVEQMLNNSVSTKDIIATLQAHQVGAKSSSQ